MDTAWQDRISPGEARAELARLVERHPELGACVEGFVGAYDALCACFRGGGPLYVCGNGGSFSDAQHIKSELSKRFMRPRPIGEEVKARLAGSELGRELAGRLEAGLPVIVLGESHSLHSAFCNDSEPDFAFAQELHSFASHVPGGALLAISTSGRSRNVLAAATVARAFELPVIAFTGPRENPLAAMADVAWLAPGGDTPEIQENQVVLYHAMCRMIEVAFFAG